MRAIEAPSLWPARTAEARSRRSRSSGSTWSASSWKNAGVRGAPGGSERPWPKRENATTRRPVAARSRAGKSRHSPTDPRPSCSSRSGAPPSPGSSRVSRARSQQTTVDLRSSMNSLLSSQLFARPDVVADRRADGTLVLRAAQPLGEYAPSMAHLLRAGAEAHPDRLLAADRDGAVTWGEGRAAADAIGQALLDRGLGLERPVMILSGNSIEHLLLMIGAYTAGVPVLPISSAYSLLSRDHERLRQIVELCTPGLVFADDQDAFGSALEAASARGAAPVVGVDELAAAAPGAEVERAFERLGPDTVAKILFTSGSTGAPKGVLNTHRMLCSNQQALGQVWPFMRSEPPVLVDWLPWSHTFGGNHNVGQVLAFGGTLHIDDGKPTPALFDRTVAALRAVRPTVYYNVPAGWALLVPRLEGDRELAEAFFSRLRLMFYAGASLPGPLWGRARAVADAIADHPVPLTASWGTTETAPGATTAHFASATCGCIGVPLPGVALKLVPDGAKREIRVRGPNVTPGYHRNEEATAAAFDDEGFYRTGDAVRLVADDDPDQGLLFDGRLSEDFKLVTGTWVHVGKVRGALVAAAGVLSDAVIAGHDREQVGALAWVNTAEAERASLDGRALREHLGQALAELNAEAGSAARVERLLLLDEPPSVDAGEITDKGYVNQRAVLARRSRDIERLFAEPVDEAVITPNQTGA